MNCRFKFCHTEHTAEPFSNDNHLLKHIDKFWANRTLVNENQKKNAFCHFIESRVANYG